MTISSGAETLDSKFTEEILRCSIFTSVFCITKTKCPKLSIDAFCYRQFQLKTTEPASRIKCNSFGQLRRKFENLFHTFNLDRIHILNDSIFFSPLIFNDV